METNNGINERFGDRGGGVGVAQCDEVSVLGEAVHHGEDDPFAVNSGKAFDEVERYVGPHLRGDL